MKNKLKLVLTMLFTAVNSVSFAQEFETKEEVLQEDVFSIVENMPEFPGGQDSLYQFLSSTIIYPNEAKEKQLQGVVYVNFIIEKDGSVTNVKILRGIHQLLDDETLRVMGLLPKWIPGTQNGEAVRVSFNLPFSFKIKE